MLGIHKSVGNHKNNIQGNRKNSINDLKTYIYFENLETYSSEIKKNLL